MIGVLSPGVRQEEYWSTSFFLSSGIFFFLYYSTANVLNSSSSYCSAQSWTALFRAFSSNRQPSASLTKLFLSWTRLLAELDKP